MRETLRSFASQGGFHLIVGGLLLSVLAGFWLVAALGGMPGYPRSESNSEIGDVPPIWWPYVVPEAGQTDEYGMYELTGEFPELGTWSRRWFGTDAMGHSLLVLLTAGLPAYAVHAVMVIAISVGGGTLLGASAAYFMDTPAFGQIWAGKACGLAYHLVDRTLTLLPRIVVLLILVRLAQYRFFWIAVAIAVTNLPKTARLMFERVRRLKPQPFVQAAVEIGVPHSRVLWRKLVLSHCRPILLTQSSFAVADFILFEATMTYLVRNAASSGNEGFTPWGVLIEQGKETIMDPVARFELLVPLGAVIMVILSFHVIGDGLSLMYSYRERQ